MKPTQSLEKINRLLILLISDESIRLFTKISVRFQVSIRGGAVPDTDSAIIARRSEPQSVGTPIKVEDTTLICTQRTELAA